MIDNNKGFSTLSVHGGEERNNEHFPLTTPIYQTATYTFENTASLHDFFQGKTPRVAEYGRYGNPTMAVAQNKLKALDNAESCLLFASGMTAICTAILSFCKHGSHIVITNDSYRRTRQFLLQVLGKFGIEHSFVEPSAQAIEKGIKKNTRLLISESPTNPYLRVIDLEAVVAICKKNKIKSMIDSTFATPLNQRPLDFGIDLVVHSVTKYLGGHNDILGGALLGKAHLIDAIKELQSIMGGLLDPNASYLLIRGLKTFALRMKQQNESSMKISQFLESHDKVERVWYPGLESHPDHKIAKAQMFGFGGVISFKIKSDLEGTSKFIDRLSIPQIAPSLGGVESLIEQPALMSYYDLTKEERQNVGIYNNLVRFAVGIEDTDDLISDLEKSLSQV